MSRFGSLSQPEYGEEEYITESLADTSTGIEGSFLHPQSQRQTTGEEGILITGVPISSDLQVVNVGSQYYVIYDENKKISLTLGGTIPVQNSLLLPVIKNSIIPNGTIALM
jgi:hypothetical protein